MHDAALGLRRESLPMECGICLVLRQGAPVRYTYDFEFIEDGKTIEPISMGMVCVERPERELYLVFNDFDTRKVAANWWLMENVMPSIDHTTHATIDFQGAKVVRDLLVTDPTSVTRS